MDNYYVQDGVRLFKKCKSCICTAKKTPKKPRGFALLAPDVQAAIKLQLANRRMKLTEIAKEHGITYANLTYWVRNNLIV
jgi:hypothetical protein